MHRPRMAHLGAVLLMVTILLAACSNGPAPAPVPATVAPSTFPDVFTPEMAPTMAPSGTPSVAGPALPPATDVGQAALDEGGEVLLPDASSSTALAGAAPPTDTPAAPAAPVTPVPATAAPTAYPTVAPVQPDPPLLAASSTPSRTVFSKEPYPLQIDVMRQHSYSGSEITLEQTLPPGANYRSYVVSYRSDGLKIYALMTVPTGQKPPTGWPVIIFNHGYIPPAQYRTTERYVAYVDAIARAGYIVFKSDYRGHGSSEGSTSGGGYGSPGYTDDVLNAVASMKAYGDADPYRIGMWGHSLGGSVTLRSMVVSKDIKAGVIWGGGSLPGHFCAWQHFAAARRAHA